MSKNSITIELTDGEHQSLKELAQYFRATPTEMATILLMVEKTDFTENPDLVMLTLTQLSKRFPKSL